MLKKHFNKLYPLVWVLAILCVLFCFMTALSNLNNGQSAEEKERLEEALSRAAVACYALEGAYPPDLEYLIENYNVQINTDRFTVKYELYASNLMPDITVLDFQK